MQDQSNFFSNLTVNYAISRPLPAALIALRKTVFINEVRYLTTGTLESLYDDSGIHIYLTDKETGKAVASAQVLKSEEGEIGEYGSNIPPEYLKNGFTITRVMVAREYRHAGLMRVLIYLGLQQARIWGRNRLYCFVEIGDSAAKTATKCDILAIPEHVIIGENGDIHRFQIGTQDISRMAAYTYDSLSENARSFLGPYLAEEIAETVDRRLDQFFCNSWFAAIRNKTLGRHQYIESLANMYQFVRLTTRILGRAISLSEDSRLRKHFIEHLGGEIDHEKMIENDLEALGADVEYVRTRMTPSKGIRKFMAIQESLLGFRQNPLLFLAVPFCVEGFSASLGKDFLEDLAENIRSWGGSPKSMSFIRSHVLTDGGNDGHWAKNLEIIRYLIRDDKTLQEFLTLLHTTFDALEEGYSSFAAQPDPSVLDFQNEKIQTPLVSENKKTTTYGRTISSKAILQREKMVLEETL